MSEDTKMRKKERRAAAEAAIQEPSEADIERAAADANRTQARGIDPHYGELIGVWVLVMGVREHVRGRLDAVTYHTAGARLHFREGVFHLDDFNAETPNGGQGEQRLPGPLVFQESAALWVGPQPRSWPTKY